MDMKGSLILSAATVVVVHIIFRFYAMFWKKMHHSQWWRGSIFLSWSGMNFYVVADLWH